MIWARNSRMPEMAGIRLDERVCFAAGIDPLVPLRTRVRPKRTYVGHPGW
jgi:hypothetical protein